MVQSLVRLDSMSGVSHAMTSQLAAENKQIDKKKAEIRRILNDRHASAAELAKAKEMIAQLNDKISTMEQDVARLTGPDGKNIIAPSAGSGTFTTREEGDKSFTAKVPVDFQMAQKKNVAFAFTPGSNFQQGNYTIQIYQNGFKIGEGTRELKKGGLFS